MKLCALTPSPRFQQQGLFGNTVPCAMEVSAALNGLQGGGGGGAGQPPTPPSQPPSPSIPAKQQLISAPCGPAVNNKNGSDLNKMRPENPMEDRGVDLSFDNSIVKKENLTLENEEIKPQIKVKTECDLKIKSEFKSELRENCQSSSLKSGGGRLKFFKEGRVLLELTHRVDGDKVHWVPTTNKVYWPPPASHTSRLDSNASTHTGTGSDGSLETASVHSHPSLSPWQTHSPRPSPSYPSQSPRPSPSWHPAPPHRLKAVPRKVINPPKDIIFGMKPPQGVKNYRKKIRTFKRKCRNPVSEIKIGLFILKLECNAAVPRVRKIQRPPVDPKRRAARLENTISRVTARKNRIQVPITAWRTGRTDLFGLVKGPPSAPGSPIGGVRIKSELKMVTETCTATVTCVTASPRYSNSTKVKAETRTVTAETRSIPVRTMPITPTVARVKQELPSDRLKSATVTSLMSPELHRVRMEIGPQNPLLGPNRDERDANFVSPRKRYMRDFDNGSPSAKNRRLSSEHRLSTDSLGSTSDRSSPYRAPHSPHRGALSPGGASPRPSAKVSNFSIDSIMGGTPKPTPTTPSKNSHLRSPSHLPIAPTPTRPSPMPARSPPPSNPSYPPYMYPGVHPLLQQDPRFQSLLDPRIAQLAGLADPRLSNFSDPRLNPMADPRLTPGSAYPFPMLNPYAAFNPFVSAASSLASQAANSVWTPPVATSAMSSPTPTPPPATIAPPRQFASSPTPTFTPTAQRAPASPHRPQEYAGQTPSIAHRPPDPLPRPPDIQYRGEPTMNSKPRSQDSDDAPLNLSMKPTSL